MDELASMKIVIEAEDRASAAIANVGSSVNDLGSAGAAAAGQTAAVNAAMTGSAKSSAVLGASVTQTKNNLKQLETGLESQKATTLEYTKSLRDSANTLREKQTAVQNAAKAYKTNTAALKENGENLRYQVKLLDGTVATNKERIASLRSENKYLKHNSGEYKTNMSAIKAMQAENTRLKDDRKSLTAAILDNDKAINTEALSYKNAQSAVKQAASGYRIARDNVAASKQAEKEYSEVISQTSSKLSEQTKAVETAKSANAGMAEATEKTVKSADSLKDTGKQWKEVGEGIDTVTKPIQYAAMAFAAGGVASAKFAIDFEDNFASVKKTVDGTPEQLDAIKQSIIDMSTVGINGHSAIPLTTAELTELAAAGGQLGIQTENIADFTEVMAQMGTATNLVGEEGAATLARFMNVMGISQGEIRNVGSAIVDLGNNSATTEAEIAAMALRMGKYGSTIGMSAADVLGYSAALSSLGIEAQMGGSAIGRTWLSIESAVASGGDALKAFAKYSGKSAKEFKEQWNTDSKGAFNGLLKGLQSADNLTLALDKLGIRILTTGTATTLLRRITALWTDTAKL